MDAHISDHDPATCPICGQDSSLKMGFAGWGLFRCRHCRQKLVVSWSGHYVRDPFTLRQIGTEQMLRRQSQPLARMWRDVGIIRYVPLLAAIGGTMLLASMSPMLIDQPDYQPQQELQEPQAVPDGAGSHNLSD